MEYQSEGQSFSNQMKFSYKLHKNQINQIKADFNGFSIEVCSGCEGSTSCFAFIA